MAYPTLAGPYGLRPINLVGGQVYAGQTRQIPIASGSATDIFYGDVVALTTSGTLEKVTTTDTASNVVGVFLGVTYVNPTTKQPTYAQFYDGPITGSTTFAYVQDDPDQLYQVAVCATGSTAIGGLTRAAVGQNVALVQNSGNTQNGDSRVAVLNSTGTATTLPMRVIDVIPETTNTVGSYTEVVVKFNIGVHTYTTADAVA